MKKIILSLILLGVIFSCQREDVFEEPIKDDALAAQEIKSKADINKLIVQALKEGRYFKWSELSTDDLWKAIEFSDYKVNVFWGMDEVSKAKGSNSIEEIILSNESKTGKSESPIYERSKTLNYLGATIANKQTLIDLLDSNDVVYIEPLYEVISEAELLAKSAFNANGLGKASTVTTNISTNRGRNFLPAADISFVNSNIQSAWDRGYDGKGITVAVIDHGTDKNHSLFGSGAAVKSSHKVTNPVRNATYKRSMERYGYFKDNPFAFWQGWDGVYETQPSPLPNHGTAMLNIIGGPPNELYYTNNGSPFWGTGVAYGANLISIRSSRTVFIAPLSSRIGVKKAFESLIHRTDVKVISMSQGLIIWDEGIARAIRKNSNKLIFCAGGTFSKFLLNVIVSAADLADVNFDRSSITLFPAKMPEVISVTGINENYNHCDDCFGKSDFVVMFNEKKNPELFGVPVPDWLLSVDGGSSSVATATTAGMAALIWSTNLGLTKGEVYQKMKNISEKPVNRHPKFGHGRLDMSKFKDNVVPRVFINLKGNNNRYVCSENGQKSMKCNRSALGPWEKFELITLSDGKVALRGNNGRYVSSENGQKSMKCNRSAIGSWEKFSLIRLSDGKIALKGNNGRYVSSENGQKSMKCNRSAIGSWEKFKISYY